MARFPAYGGPGEGAHRFGGSGLGTPPPGLPGGNVSFTVGGPTLQALQERQQRLQQAAPELPGPAGMQSPWQGASYLANTFVNSLQQNRAAEEEERGSQEMAQALSTGIDPVTGQLKPEAMATVMARNPEVGLQFIGDMIKSRRDKVQTLTPEEEMAAGLNPAGTYQKTSTGEISRVTEPEAADEWINIPAPEGSKPGQIFQQNATTKEIRSVGGSGITIQNEQPVPAEIAARIALGDEFLGNFETIKQVAEAGGLSGPIDVTTAAAGRGPEGAAYRQIQAGIDAVRRNLTGAGMSASEADEYASRYLPGYRDDAATVSSKLQQLHDHLMAIRTGVTTGRKAQPAPTEPAQVAPATETPAPATPAPAEAPAASADVPVIDPKDMETYRKLPPGAKYKLPGDDLVYEKGAK